MTRTDRLSRQVAFLIEADTLKMILRQRSLIAIIGDGFDIG